jgi:hypothetical protein
MSKKRKKRFRGCPILCEEGARILFENYRPRHGPWGSAAGPCLWPLTGGTMGGTEDYAPGRRAGEP